MISTATRKTLRRMPVPMALVTMAVLFFPACTPTIRVATDEPITINLNVNIKHEILVKVDRELDDIFADDSDIF
jgi:hypothetical protein